MDRTDTCQDPTVRDILAGIAQVIAMSDPDSLHFVDSAADCLEALLQLEPASRCILQGYDNPAG
jgi:hypothetical protein